MKRPLGAPEHKDHCPAHRPGPSTLEDLFLWPQPQTEGAMRMLSAEEQGELGDLAQDLAVTTCYSGIGCVEMVMPMLLDAFALSGLVPADCACRPFRAMDTDSVCRDVLGEHKSPPIHIQGDICLRAPLALRMRLDWLRVNLLSTYKARASTSVSRDTLRKTHLALSRAFLRAAKKALSRTALRSTAWCYAHDTYCPCEPASAKYRVEAAGVTCVAWSTLGNHEGWLHSSAMPCVVWLESIRQTEPDLVLCECVRAFPEADVTEYLGESYIVQALLTTPVDLGAPAARHRKYTLMWNKKSVIMRFDYTAEHFAMMFHRDCMLDGAVYFCAPDPVVMEYVASLAERRQVTWTRGMSMIDVLPAGPRVRARQYGEALAAVRGREVAAAATPGGGAPTVNVAAGRAQTVEAAGGRAPAIEVPSGGALPTEASGGRAPAAESASAATPVAEAAGGRPPAAEASSRAPAAVTASISAPAVEAAGGRAPVVEADSGSGRAPETAGGRAPAMAAFCDLTQSPLRGPSFPSALPALTKGSWPWCAHHERLLFPIERFAVQGVPLRCLLPCQTVVPERYMPFHRDPDSFLLPREMRRVTGNAMHLEQLGCSLLFLLAAAKPRKDEV